MRTPEQRIEAALDVAMTCGGFDGAHHKKWVIDQMVRALTGCEGDMATDDLDPCEAYRAWVATYCEGEEGPDTYEWDAGIAP